MSYVDDKDIVFDEDNARSKGGSGTVEQPCSVCPNCSNFKRAMRYIVQHGHKSGMARVRQVCQMALDGKSLEQINRQNVGADRTVSRTEKEEL